MRLMGLIITVQISDPAFFIEVNFNQLVIFEANQTPYFIPATTWRRSGIGTNVNPDYIIQHLDAFFDSFLNGYLKANVKRETIEKGVTQ
jgi:hypothetical protein